MKTCVDAGIVFAVVRRAIVGLILDLWYEVFATLFAMEVYDRTNLYRERFTYGRVVHFMPCIVVLLLREVW